MESVVKAIVSEKGFDFKRLEQFVWCGVVSIFRRVIVEILEAIDRELAAGRDVRRFELKEMERRKLVTSVGVVEFRRRYYWDREEKRWVYLLDEALGLEPEARKSPGLVELATVWAAHGPSYRDSRDRLEQVMGERVLSHEGIRQTVHRVAEHIRTEEKRVVCQEEGRRRARVIFIEADGIYVAEQGERGKKRERRRREAKLAVVHEGWRPRYRQSGGKEYELVNPVYIPCLKGGEAFWEEVRGVLYTRYADLEHTWVVINGDAAEWIRAGTGHFKLALYQYDRFHLYRDLRRVLRCQPGRLEGAKAALERDDVAQFLIEVVEAEKAAATPEERAEIGQMRELLVGMGEALRDYRVRLKEKGVAVDPAWRGLGAAESNVDKFSNRLKKQGRAWREEGLAAMLTVQAKLYEGTLLSHLARAKTALNLPEWETVKVSSGRLVKEVARASLGVIRGRFPAAYRGTEGYGPLFRDLQRLQPLC